MTIALSIYAGLYLLATVAIIADHHKDEDPLWDTLSDAVLLPLGFAGILLYTFEVQLGDLRLIWKVVAPLIVLGQVVTNALAIFFYLLTKEADLDRGGAWFASVGTFLLLVPMFATNLLYAFG